MRFKTIGALLGLALLTAGLAWAKDSGDQQSEKIRKMAAAADLYRLQPASKAAVQKSVGYADFKNLRTNLLLLSTARGAGVAVNTKSKPEARRMSPCSKSECSRRG